MRDDYKKQNDGPNLISGDLLNKFGKSINADKLAMQNQQGLQRVSSHIDSELPAPPWVQGIAVITDASDTCAEADSTPVETDAPCKSENRYIAEFRYYDRSTQEWKHLKGQRLDAGAYWEGVPPGEEEGEKDKDYPTDASQSPSSGIGFGAIPQFHVGDVVPAYWDHQRNWLIPIHSPPQDTPRLIARSQTTQNIPTPCCLATAGLGSTLDITLSGISNKGVFDIWGEDEEAEWNESELAYCDCENCDDWNVTFTLHYVPGATIEKDCGFGLVNAGHVEPKLPNAPTFEFPCAAEGDETYIIVDVECLPENDRSGVLNIDMQLWIKGCKVADWFFEDVPYQTPLNEESNPQDILATANKVCAPDNIGFTPLGENITCEDLGGNLSTALGSNRCKNHIPYITANDIGEKAAEVGHGTVCHPIAGDRHLLEFFDQTNCRWLASSLPTIRMPKGASAAANELPDADNTDCVSFYIELRYPGEADWRVVTPLHFYIPFDNDGSWCQTASTFNAFWAPHGTEVRVTVASTDFNYDIAARSVLLEFEGIGRGPGPFKWGTRGCFSETPDNKIIKTGWDVCAQVEGRYLDQPIFIDPDAPSGGNDNGVFLVNYVDEKDAWWIRVAITGLIENIVAPPPPTQFESASSSSSTSSKSHSSTSSVSTSMSVSSQTGESWSSQSFTTSSASSYSSVSTSSISSSISSSSQTHEFSLPGVNEEYCCVEVVSNIECNADGTIANVCKRTICFPKIDGVDCEDQIRTQECGACDLDISSESSFSSVSSSSSSLHSSSSTSSMHSECPPLFTDIDGGTGFTASEPQTLLIVRPDGTASQDYWDDVIDDNALTMELIDDGGALGTFAFDEETGEMTYTPAVRTTPIGRYFAANDVDYVKTPPNAIFDISDVSLSPFTLEMWFHTARTPAVINSLFSIGLTAANAFLVTISSTLGVRLFGDTTGGGGWDLDLHLGVGAISVDTMHHLALTRDASGEYAIYIDGTSAGTTTLATDLVLDTPVVTIGQYYLGGDNTFDLDGAIYQVRWHQSALTQPQLAAIAAGGVPPTPAEEWLFDDAPADAYVDGTYGIVDGAYFGTTPIYYPQQASDPYYAVVNGSNLPVSYYMEEDTDLTVVVRVCDGPDYGESSSSSSSISASSTSTSELSLSSISDVSSSSSSSSPSSGSDVSDISTASSQSISSESSSPSSSSPLSVSSLSTSSVSSTSSSKSSISPLSSSSSSSLGVSSSSSSSSLGFSSSSSSSSLGVSSSSSSSSPSSPSSQSSPSSPSSQSSFSSASSQSLSSVSDCTAFQLSSPHLGTTVCNDGPLCAITMNPLSTQTEELKAFWLQVVIVGDLEMTLLGNTGDGSVFLDETTGNVVYTPATPDDVNNSPVTVDVRYTDAGTTCFSDVTLIITITDIDP